MKLISENGGGTFKIQVLIFDFSNSAITSKLPRHKRLNGRLESAQISTKFVSCRVLTSVHV